VYDTLTAVSQAAKNVPVPTAMFFEVGLIVNCDADARLSPAMPMMPSATASALREFFFLAMSLAFLSV
jgi:hypothetical protein